MKTIWQIWRRWKTGKTQPGRRRRVWLGALSAALRLILSLKAPGFRFGAFGVSLADKRKNAQRAQNVAAPLASWAGRAQVFVILGTMNVILIYECWVCDALARITVDGVSVGDHLQLEKRMPVGWKVEHRGKETYLCPGCQKKTS